MSKGSNLRQEENKYHGESHKQNKTMDKKTFSEIQELENTVFGYVEEKKGKEIKAFSISAYRKWYGQVDSSIMCIRKRITTANSIEVVAVVADLGVVQVLEYSYSSIFVKSLDACMKRLDIQVGALADDEWHQMIEQAKAAVKLANGIL
mgnify:CR=1 FL=1